MNMMAQRVALRRELQALLEKMARPQPQAVLLVRMRREREIRAALGEAYYVAMLAAERELEAA